MTSTKLPASPTVALHVDHINSQQTSKKRKNSKKRDTNKKAKMETACKIKKAQSHKTLHHEHQTTNHSQTLTNSKNTDQTSANSSIDRFVALLTDGLRCDNSILVDQVLCSRSEKLIEKTVRILPNTILLPFIDYLNKCLYQSAEKGLIASKWLQVLLCIHSTYLMSNPDIKERLSPMYEVIESHATVYPKLARLQGKISLIATQINNHKKMLNNYADTSNKSPLVFEDVSDEDIDGDQTQDELIPSPSEYDDYSGLSDDLDLGFDNEDGTEELNDSDNNNDDQRHDSCTNDDDSS